MPKEEKNPSENFDVKRGRSSLKAFEAEDYADVSMALCKRSSAASDVKLAAHFEYLCAAKEKEGI